MSNVTQATSYTKIKQSTDHDSRSMGPLVSAFEAQTSTLNQSTINLTQVVCDLDRKSNVMVFIDGLLLREGAGNDYTWTTGVGNTSNQINLVVPLNVDTNIQVYKIGIAKNNVANAETIQAGINLVSNQVDQKNVNRIINGSMMFAQRGSSFATVAANAYTLDRWKYNKSGAMVHTISQSTNVPTDGYSSNSLLVDCTTLDASIAATDFATVFQIIEGNMLRPFKGKSMVLGFRVYATKTGTYCLAIKNGTNTKSLIKEYTVTASNTWQTVYVRFQHDSTGTWAYDTGAGMQVIWTLAAGTTYQTTADTWQNGDFLATANQVNSCDSTANDFIITDVVLVEDNDSLNKIPTFITAGRDFDTELHLCQRYYEKTYNLSVAPGTVGAAGYWENYDSTGTTNGMSFSVEFKTRKRINPTLTTYSPASGAINNVRSNDGAADRPSTTSSGETAGSVNFTPSAISRVTNFHWIADAEL